MLARAEDNGSTGWWEGVGFWRLLDAVVWIVDLEGWITCFVIGWDQGGLEWFGTGDGGGLLCRAVWSRGSIQAENGRSDREVLITRDHMFI